MRTHTDNDTTRDLGVLGILLHAWARKSGVFSALPDAPVVTEAPPRRRTATLKRLARRLARWDPQVAEPDVASACR